MNVKRRGIYVADLGEKIDSSVEGGIRPVLVLQNDKGNEHSTTVIIAPITSKLTKHRIPSPTYFCRTQRLVPSGVFVPTSHARKSCGFLPVQ